MPSDCKYFLLFSFIHISLICAKRPRAHIRKRSTKHFDTEKEKKRKLWTLEKNLCVIFVAFGSHIQHTHSSSPRRLRYAWAAAEKIANFVLYFKKKNFVFVLRPAGSDRNWSKRAHNALPTHLAKRLQMQLWNLQIFCMYKSFIHFDHPGSPVHSS